MKKILTLLLLAIGFGASAQNLGIRTNNPKATLDVVGDAALAATPDGILLPRLTLTQLAAKTGYGADQIGAVVYVSDVTGTPNAATDAIEKVGYYHFNGVKWIPLLPKFVGVHATSTANPTLTAGEIQKLTYSAKDYDVNNWFDAPNGTYTPKVAGYYEVSLSARVFDANKVGTRNLQLFKNGIVTAIGHTASVNSHNVRLNAIVYMNGTTDYLDARLYSAEALTVTGNSAIYTQFQANLVGK